MGVGNYKVHFTNPTRRGVDLTTGYIDVGTSTHVPQIAISGLGPNSSFTTDFDLVSTPRNYYGKTEGNSPVYAITRLTLLGFLNDGDNTTWDYVAERMWAAMTMMSATGSAVYGQSVLLTAYVENPADPEDPALETMGPCEIQSDGVAIASGVLVYVNPGSHFLHTVNGANPLPVGTHALRVKYGTDEVVSDWGDTLGDDTHYGGFSEAISLVISKANTTLALAANPSPALCSEPVDLTATVSVTAPGAGTPTGTVTFKEGVTTLGTAPLIAGVATLEVDFTVGTHGSLTAVYAGDTNFNGSTSNTISEVVTIAASAMEIDANPNPSVLGEEVIISVIVVPVDPATATPTGTVEFFDGVTSLGVVALVSGAANLTTSDLTAGSHTLSAVYSGAACFTGSNDELVQVVEPAPFNDDCPPQTIEACPTLDLPTVAEDALVDLPTVGVEAYPELPANVAECRPCGTLDLILTLPGQIMPLASMGNRMAVGGMLQLTATVKNSTNSFNPTVGLEFCSSDSDILTVGSHTGLVTAVGPGTATVSVTWHDLYAQADFTVI